MAEWVPVDELDKTPQDTRHSIRVALARIEAEVRQTRADMTTSLDYAIASYALAKRGSRPGFWLGIAAMFVSSVALLIACAR